LPGVEDETGSTDPGTGSSEEPPRVINVAEKIEELVAVVEGKMTLQRIGPIGVALLIWTALSLLTQLERSLNRIFGASRARPLARRLLLYWSTLTLGPVILTAASVAGSKAATAFEHVPGVSGLLSFAGWAGPTLVGILVVATFYKLMPNTEVRYRAAVGGALVSVPLWLLAKAGFSFYVTRLVGTGNLYGALGLLPLFLLWINLSWLIFLFGAQLAQTAANLGRLQITERSRRIALGPADLLAAAIAVARPFVAGRGNTSVEQIATQLQLPAESVQRLLDRLSSARVVCRVESDQTEAYVLARPAGKIPVIEVFGVHHGAESNTGRSFHGDIASLVTRAELRTRDELGDFTLADVIAADVGDEV
jgi:membrane protein